MGDNMIADTRYKNYLSIFKEFLVDKDEIQILSYKGEVLKLSFNKNPYFMIGDDYVNTFEFIKQFTNRCVKRNECFYILKNISKNYSFLIPQTELSYFLQRKEILNLFINIKKVRFNPLYIVIDEFYHGTPNKKIKNMRDLDINRGNIYGDYGKGVYLTNVFNLAKSYSMTTRWRKQIVGNILVGQWFNSSMDELLDRLTVKIQKNESGFTYYDVLEADNEVFRVKIFIGNTEDWRRAIWDGWIKGKQQHDCDIVLGPISVGYLPILQRDILYKLNKYSGDYRKELECRYEFEKKLDIYRYEGEDSTVYEGFQLCIYNQKVLNYFV